MGMFDNYERLEDEYQPCNMFEYLPWHSHSTMVAGGTYDEVFEVPFPYDDMMESIVVIFRRGETLVLEKNPAEIVANGCSTLIKCHLEPEETALFGGSVLDTLVQSKVVYDGDSYFSGVGRIRVRDTIDAEE